MNLIPLCTRKIDRREKESGGIGRRFLADARPSM